MQFATKHKHLIMLLQSLFLFVKGISYTTRADTSPHFNLNFNCFFMVASWVAILVAFIWSLDSYPFRVQAVVLASQR